RLISKYSCKFFYSYAGEYLFFTFLSLIPTPQLRQPLNKTQLPILLRHSIDNWFERLINLLTRYPVMQYKRDDNVISMCNLTLELATPKTKEFQSELLLLSCWNVGNSESFPYFNRISVGVNCLKEECGL